MRYNTRYNKRGKMWIDDLLLGIIRKKAKITFDPHLFDRKEYRNLSLDKIEETIRNGELYQEKCEFPNKVCFRKYFGKENISYIVIARIHKEFIEVKTAWPRRGR